MCTFPQADRNKCTCIPTLKLLNYWHFHRGTPPKGEYAWVATAILVDRCQEMDRALKRAAKGEDLMVEAESEAAWIHQGQVGSGGFFG